MKDLFQNYHRHKAIVNIWILSLSVILAIGINTFVINDDISQSLKASVIDINSTKSSQSDLEFAVMKDSILLKINTPIADLKELSFSLAYNPELIDFSDLSSGLGGANFSLLENSPGFSTVIMTLDNSQTINAKSEIAKINFERLSEDTIHLNPLNVNFIDKNGDTFLLTTQWLVF